MRWGCLVFHVFLSSSYMCVCAGAFFARDLSQIVLNYIHYRAVVLQRFNDGVGWLINFMCRLLAAIINTF